MRTHDLQPLILRDLKKSLEMLNLYRGGQNHLFLHHVRLSEHPTILKFKEELTVMGYQIKSLFIYDCYSNKKLFPDISEQQNKRIIYFMATSFANSCPRDERQALRLIDFERLDQIEPQADTISIINLQYQSQRTDFEVLVAKHRFGCGGVYMFKPMVK